MKPSKVFALIASCALILLFVIAGHFDDNSSDNLDESFSKTSKQTQSTEPAEKMVSATAVDNASKISTTSRKTTAQNSASATKTVKPALSQAAIARELTKVREVVVKRIASDMKMSETLINVTYASLSKTDENFASVFAVPTAFQGQLFVLRKVSGSWVISNFGSSDSSGFNCDDAPREVLREFGAFVASCDVGQRFYPYSTSQQHTLNRALKSMRFYAVDASGPRYSRGGSFQHLWDEKLPQWACDYALANTTVNWNENALAAARDYLSMRFAREDIPGLLSKEKFTADELDYAVSRLNEAY